VSVVTSRVEHAPLNGPWPQLSVFDRRWPGPGRPATPATVLAVCLAAAVAALSVPLDRGGVGWLVTALAGTGALFAARVLRYHDPHPGKKLLSHEPAPDDPMRFVWATATVLLLGVGTLRAAGWLVALCLLTAALTGILATAGGHTMRAMATGAGMALLAGFRSLPWLSRVFRSSRSVSGRVLATAAVSVVLLAVFGGLFASADATFASLLHGMIPDISGLTVARWIFVFTVAFVVLGGAAFLRAAPPALSKLDILHIRRVGRWEWAVPLGLLVVLFAAFVAIQVTVLFGGSRHVLTTDGLTYADYARGGFWQLLVVTGLTLLVLAGAARWAPRDTATDRTLIRIVLGALAVLTLVIVASALHRMVTYSDTYGLTRLRLLVALCEIWLGVTFLMVIAAGVRLRAAWLPRAVVGAGVLALLGLAAANPDALIAEHNVTRFEQTGRIDTIYLSDLSLDAVPALMELPQPQRDCALQTLHRNLIHDSGDWRGWNWGRSQAGDLLTGPPRSYSERCWTD
jgi:hypothetical protein